MTQTWCLKYLYQNKIVINSGLIYSGEGSIYFLVSNDVLNSQLLMFEVSTDNGFMLRNLITSTSIILSSQQSRMIESSYGSIYFTASTVQGGDTYL